MPNKMIIDASHPEETRVVVLRGNRVEDFDFESASKKQLRGNIYLAKVIRVEPSLQAAFVDYGGNRHGFLAFSEIHPDYYQIPVADRQALIEDLARAAARGDDEDSERPERGELPERGDRGERNGRRSRRHKRDGRARHARGDERISETVPEEGDGLVAGEADHDQAPLLTDDSAGGTSLAAAAENLAGDMTTSAAMLAAETDGPKEEPQAGSDAPSPVEALDAAAPQADDEAPRPDDEETVETVSAIEEAVVTETAAPASEASGDPTVDSSGDDSEDDEEDEDSEEEDAVEQMGGDALEEVPYRPQRAGRRQYKIQEVIKRRQILLVQVVKEERGNKGAALTTFLSLAGRYSVLMPNTARGGGISRKITDGADRKRLKEIAQELEVPQGMGVIVRTAGAARTRMEIRRDFEYLMRIWEEVRETTLKSTAPTLVYEEGSLIKRSIRDLYSKEIDEILVAGDAGYLEARNFMRMLMPSHAKCVKLYRDATPIFVRSGVEQQLDAMFSSQVTLKSGGYIVINQTEALVAIDVNSGRSTREHNIEDTALRTNLEAADEVARQLRLRDLAGLIVVDFIDMEENRNNRAVEKRMKDALKNDRARIQVGRISHFGLLEMSRQRMRTGVLEGSTVPCPHCAGSGMVRSTSSLALHVLRVLEDSLIRTATHDLILHTRTPVALYILNQKRAHLRDLEMRFGVNIIVDADDSLTGSTYHALERGELATGTPVARAMLDVSALEAEDNAIEDEEEVEIEAEAEDAPGTSEEASDDNDGAEDGGESENGRRRKRRRRRRGGNGEREPNAAADAAQPSDEALGELALHGDDAIAAAPEGESDAPGGEGEAREGRGRRRGRGRGRWRPERDPIPETFRVDDEEAGPETAAARETTDSGDGEAVAAEVARHTPPPTDFADFGAAAPASFAAAAHDERAEPPAAWESAPAAPAEPAPETKSAETVAPPPSAPTVEEPPRPKRSGWWQKAKATFGSE